MDAARTFQIAAETALSEIELLPCPFCGGPVTIERTLNNRSNRRWWGIICRNTINLGGTYDVQICPQVSPEAAAQRWNMRNGVNHTKPADTHP